MEEKYGARESDKPFLGIIYKLGESDEIVRDKQIMEAKKHGGEIGDFNWLNVVLVPPKKIIPVKMGTVIDTGDPDEEYGAQ